ncbi:hypothetical protein ACFXPS_29795 [Nocardia sp. NPDC059091]|uniref:hypothetical protein n=1 Tax=unclassified Nocardia TaxID=2637762 RepID=UPI0036B5C76B
MHMLTREELPALPRGDVRLLDSDIAQDMLTSTEPARARVGVLDFQARFPGGSTAAEFAQRGQA